MARSIDEVIAGLPKARRERVEAKAARLARDMIEDADSLGDIRKAVSWVSTRNQAGSADDVVAKVHAWGDRKRRFSQRQILLAQDVLMKQGWIAGYS